MLLLCRSLLSIHTLTLSLTPKITDIKYGSLLEVDETLKKLRSTGPKTGEAMLVEEVGPEEIAGVVSKWTGMYGCGCPWVRVVL